MARLCDQEIRRCRDDGYASPRFRLNDAPVSRMQQALNTLICQNPGARPEQLASAPIDGQNDDGVPGSPDFFELAMHTGMVNMVAQVIGPDVVLWGRRVMYKPVSEGYETPRHQDGHYWSSTPLANCTVWATLESSTRENGCLGVIPGSHAARQLHPHLREDRTGLNDFTVAHRGA